MIFIIGLPAGRVTHGVEVSHSFLKAVRARELALFVGVTELLPLGIRESGDIAVFGPVDIVLVTRVVSVFIAGVGAVL